MYLVVGLFGETACRPPVVPQCHVRWLCIWREICVMREMYPLMHGCESCVSSLCCAVVRVLLDGVGGWGGDATLLSYFAGFSCLFYVVTLRGLSWCDDATVLSSLAMFGRSYEPLLYCTL